jgi:high-affinity Fe2+/Pb2+ permease
MIGIEDLPVLTFILRVALFMLSIYVVYGAIREHMPWSMITALLGGVGMALTLICAGLGPLGYNGFDLRPVTFVLSFVSAMLLLASVMTFHNNKRKGREQVKGWES